MPSASRPRRDCSAPVARAETHRLVVTAVSTPMTTRRAGRRPADASVIVQATKTPAMTTQVAMRGQADEGRRATRPTARSRSGTANVAKRAGSSVGSEPKVKSGTIVQSTIVAAPTSGMTTRASSSEARSDPSIDGHADHREREVDDAGDDADRLGPAAPEDVAQQEELQSEEVRNHDRPSTSVLPPTRSTKRSSRVRPPRTSSMVPDGEHLPVGDDGDVACTVARRGP